MSVITPRTQDELLDNLALATELWPENTAKDARKIVKKLMKVKGSAEKAAILSGALAAVASALGSFPLVGGILGTAPAFMGNYVGTQLGVEIGYKYAEQCDLKQDLLNNSESLYTMLAIRLLDRFLETHRKTPRRKSMMELAEKINQNLPILEANAIALFSKTAKKKLIEKQISKVTSPLKEVCLYVKDQEHIFASVILRNELMTVQAKKENAELREMVRDLKGRVKKLESKASCSPKS